MSTKLIYWASLLSSIAANTAALITIRREWTSMVTTHWLVLTLWALTVVVLRVVQLRTSGDGDNQSDSPARVARSVACIILILANTLLAIGIHGLIDTPAQCTRGVYIFIWANAVADLYLIVAEIVLRRAKR